MEYFTAQSIITLRTGQNRGCLSDRQGVGYNKDAHIFTDVGNH